MKNDIKNIILDIISKYKFPINDFIFGGKVNLYHIHLLNCFAEEDILKSIWCLFQDKMIEVDSIDLCTYQDFKDYNFSSDILIGLTELGGQRWEDLFKPNWSNFIDVVYDDVSYLNPVNMDLKSPNKSLLIEILKPLSLQNLEDFVVVEKEWKPCYWKVISNLDCYNFNYTANSIQEKIIIDEIYNSLSNYSKLFCEETEYFL